MSDSLDFRGVVSLYENGHLKWTKENKITYLGRAYLLKMLANATSINNRALISAKAITHLTNSARICAVAFGNGGAMEGSVLNRVSQYSDTGLYNPVPVKRINISEYSRSSLEKIEELKDYIAYRANSDDEFLSDYSICEDKTKGIIDIDTNGGKIYFKKIDEISLVNSNVIGNNAFGDMTDPLKIRYTSSFVTFTIKIKPTDFTNRVISTEESFSSISEMGLFIGEIKQDRNAIWLKMNDPEQAEDVWKLDPRIECQDRGIYEINDGSTEDLEDKSTYNCATFVNNSVPVMFSHLTFPAEDIVEGKDLSFKYSVFV